MNSSNQSFDAHRRAFLKRSAGSLGWLALHHLFNGEAPTIANVSSDIRAMGDPLAPRPPHHMPKAKSVICLFQHGGPSQMDLFDPKPELTRWDRKPYPGQLEVHFNKQQGNLLASPFAFRPRGQSGTVLSDLLPH